MIVTLFSCNWSLLISLWAKFSNLLFYQNFPRNTLMKMWSEWKSLSCVWPFVTQWTAAHQAPLSMEFSRQEYWSGLPFPSPGDLPDPGIQPRSPALPADSLPTEPAGKPSENIQTAEFNISIKHSNSRYWETKNLETSRELKNRINLQMNLF